MKANDIYSLTKKDNEIHPTKEEQKVLQIFFDKFYLIEKQVFIAKIHYKNLFLYKRYVTLPLPIWPSYAADLRCNHA